MSGKNKNYNKLIFLTTLSVYLGLVLVSGSPQVFAYAATTRNFDIQQEIEFKEDLDNKPDTDELAEFLALEPENAIDEFFVELRKLKKQGNFKFGKQLISRCSYSVCDENNANATYSPEGNDSLVFEVLDKLHARLDDIFLRSNKNLPTFIGVAKSNKCKEFNNTISLDKKFFKAELSFSKNSENEAIIFSEKLNNQFKKKAEIAKDSITKQILNNTQAVPVKEFVVIVTNLPRASIDSLLK